MSGFDFSLIFFISCIGSVIFFTMGRFVGATEARNEIKDKSKKNNAKATRTEVDNDNVIDIRNHLSGMGDDERERAIDILTSYTLVYSKNQGRYVRVPRELHEVIKSLEVE